MKMSIAQITDRLLQEDEVTVLELLDLDAQTLVETFKHRVRERKLFLEKYYEEDVVEASQTYKKQSDSFRLASKEVWEEAGFDLENDAY